MAMVDPFTRHWNIAYWELENLALFNQAAYSNVIDRNRSLDHTAEHLKTWQRPSGEDGEEAAEAFDRALYRQYDAIIAGELEAEAIAQYADEVTIVASWTFAEKYLNLGLTEMRARLSLPAANSHRWPQLQVAFGECGVALVDMDSFVSADECRRVNNAIKHSGRVDAGLAQSPFFADKQGMSLRDITLETQRYYFGVADFVGAMFERCSNILRALPPVAPGGA